jgi:ribonuclease HI
MPNQNQHIPWSKPLPDVIKCNVDAAIFHNNVVTGYGICFQNSEGRFITGKSNFSTSNISVLEAEATSLLEAIKLAANNGFQFVQFKIDSKILVAAVNSHCTYINEFRVSFI